MRLSKRLRMACARARAARTGGWGHNAMQGCVQPGCVRRLTRMHRSAQRVVLRSWCTSCAMCCPVPRAVVGAAVDGAVGGRTWGTEQVGCSGGRFDPGVGACDAKRSRPTRSFRFGLRCYLPHHTQGRVRSTARGWCVMNHRGTLCVCPGCVWAQSAATAGDLTQHPLPLRPQVPAHPLHATGHEGKCQRPLTRGDTSCALAAAFCKVRW